MSQSYRERARKARDDTDKMMGQGFIAPEDMIPPPGDCAFCGHFFYENNPHPPLRLIMGWGMVHASCARQIALGKEEPDDFESYQP